MKIKEFFSCRREDLINVHAFEESASITAKDVFKAVTQSINTMQLQKLRSVMADTTSINTGKKNGISNSLLFT